MISRRILAAVALLCAFSFQANAQPFTKSQLNSQIGVNFPDNTTFQITPLNNRTIADNIVNSIMPTAPVVTGNLACFDGTTGLLKDCGVPPANTITLGSTGIVGGTSPRVLYDNAGFLGEYTNTQLTALINAVTSSLPGTIPAFPNNTSTVFLGNGTYGAVNLTTAVTGGLPNSNLAQPLAATLKGNPTSSTANAQDFTIQGLTNATPNSTLDFFIFYNHTTGTFESASASQITTAVGSGVTSIAGNSGAFTLSGLLTNSSNVLQVVAAAKSDEQTGTSATLATTPSQQQQHDSAAKMTVNFGVSGTTVTVNGSYNVNTTTSPIVRNSVGNYTITFITPFANTNYSCGGMISSDASVGVGGFIGFPAANVTAAAINVKTFSQAGVPTDPSIAMMQCYGRQ